jgi:hypothetical protein
VCVYHTFMPYELYDRNPKSCCLCKHLWPIATHFVALIRGQSSQRCLDHEVSVGQTWCRLLVR